MSDSENGLPSASSNKVALDLKPTLYGTIAEARYQRREARVRKPQRQSGCWGGRWWSLLSAWMVWAYQRTCAPARPLPPTTVALRPCARCAIFKPYRGHHCRVCGTGVLKFDHHRLWIGG
ncbi:hypothetical protein B0H17DRAFT_1194003 [Mycena rosella]|uniref:Palmitoyltransferase n=1 Tax=Mycena rosella TaxID=1033263 RepID=A0AAD7M714_MYCRO|nr:hypothetical protein B0H17DRAFT_1194003 [Mycena rosella]